MKAFNVYLNGKLYDTVYFDGNMTAEDVKNALINHDNYSPDIVVKG